MPTQPPSQGILAPISVAFRDDPPYCTFCFYFPPANRLHQHGRINSHLSSRLSAKIRTTTVSLPPPLSLALSLSPSREISHEEDISFQYFASLSRREIGGECGREMTGHFSYKLSYPPRFASILKSYTLDPRLHI